MLNESDSHSRLMTARINQPMDQIKWKPEKIVMLAGNLRTHKTGMCQTQVSSEKL
jgi:menaquinone-dependent protoporphyrinogen IX oxidase